MYSIIDETFHPDIVLKTMDSLVVGIESEMPQHIERWKEQADYALQSMEDWQRELDVLRNLLEKDPLSSKST